MPITDSNSLKPMKNLLSVLLFVSLLTPALPAFSQADETDLLSCDDLAVVADDLTYIANSMEEGVPIEENDDLDAALADVVDSLYYVAESEGSDSLYDAVVSLEDAWVAMDRYAFVDSLDAVVDDFDYIYDSECAE
jgi:hypothetical protein